VSALLHAVAVVKAGVFVVTKVIVYVFGIDLLRGEMSAEWLAYAAGFTTLAASVVALRQDNLKRMLAYSTVAQLAYVTLAAASFQPASAVGAALHIAAHGLGKITLFFAAGSIYTASGKTGIGQLDGIGRRMPWTMAAFAIGALAMIGLPPTAAFVSKWEILEGSWQAGQPFTMLVIVASTALNAAYFLPVLHRAWLRPESAAPAVDHGEAPLPIVLALTATAVLTVAFFFFHQPVLELAWQIFATTQ
jgi:multicomponent Na+:H+ antiporter subunit D